MTVTREALVAAIEELARNAASRCGVEVVEVIFRRQGRHSTLRVDIDRPGLLGVGLAECEALSRELDPDLEGLDGLPEGYDLQVSSPGLDRPIRTADDVRRNVGRRVVVETREPIEGARLFRGVLVGGEAGSLVVALDEGGEAQIPVAAVQLAHQEIEPPRRGPKGHR